MAEFIAMYAVVALAVFSAAAVVALNGWMEHNRPVARGSARVALLCWAWPLGILWLLWRLAKIAR